MARQVRWRMTWKSRLDNTYALNIYEEGYTGSSTALTPGTSPFCTTEDRGGDIFTPIHTQSGYISVVCDMATWQQLIPKDDMHHYVELWRSGQVMWCGYMSAQAYNTPLRNGLQEYQFPVVCPLSVLKGFHIETDGMCTVASVLMACIDKAKVSIDDLFFPDNMEDAEYANDLSAKLSMSNWMSKNNEFVPQANTGTPPYVPSASCYDIVESICKFFGWSLHIDKRNLYFTSPDIDSETMRRFGLQTFDEEDWDRVTYAEIESEEVENMVPASTSGKMEILQGYNSVNISAEAGNNKDYMSLELDELKWQGVSTWTATRDGKRICVAHRYNAMRHESDKDTQESRTYSYDTSEAHVEKTTYWNEREAEEVDQHLFHSMDEWEDGTVKHNYNWSDHFTVNCYATPTQNVSKLRISSHKNFTFADGMLCVSANVSAGNSEYGPFEYDAHAYSPGATGLRMSIKVGDKYWNGNAWQGTEAILLIPVGDDTKQHQTADDYRGQGHIITTKTLEQPYDGAEGYGIVFGQGDAQSGKVEITLYSAKDNRYSYYKMDNLKVSFIRSRDAQRNTNATNSYRESISSPFKESYNVSINLASDNNNEMGDGLVVDVQGGYLRNISYSDETIPMRPEKYLARRMKRQFCMFTKRYTIDVNNNVSDPYKKYFTVGRDPYAMMAVSKDYGSDIATITIDSINSNV